MEEISNLGRHVRIQRENYVYHYWINSAGILVRINLFINNEFVGKFDLKRRK